jgi:hypothetical protein
MCHNVYLQIRVAIVITIMIIKTISKQDAIAQQMVVLDIAL